MDWKEFEDPPCVSLKSGSLFKKQTKPHCWEFPGSSLVRTLHPHCWSPGFSPWSGILQASLLSRNKTQPTNNQTNPHCFPRTDSVEPWRLFSTAAAGWWAGPWAWTHRLGFQSQPCNLASCSLSFLITKMRMVMPDWWTVVIGEWDDACEGDWKLQSLQLYCRYITAQVTVLWSSAFRIRSSVSTQTKHTYVATY